MKKPAPNFLETFLCFIPYQSDSSVMLQNLLKLAVIKEITSPHSWLQTQLDTEVQMMSPSDVGFSCHLLVLIPVQLKLLSPNHIRRVASSPLLTHFQTSKPFPRGKNKPSLQLCQKVLGGLLLARWSQVFILEPIQLPTWRDTLIGQTSVTYPFL